MEINLNELIDTIDISRASNGNIEKLFHGSTSYGYRIGIDWTVNSQSTSSNSSNVTATVYIRTTGSGVTISSTTTKDVSITINGTKYLSTCTVGIGANSKKNLLSKTVTISHNSDGTKTCAFACALDINVTLGGTFYGKITHEGSGVFNQINLNTPPVWVSGGRVTIKNGSTILTDQANGTENAVKFPENASSLNLSWSGATDANGDVITYELYEEVDNGSWVNIYTGTSKSYTRSIGSGSSTQGKTYDYYVKARDSKGAYASGTQDATQVQKNTLNNSTLASSSSISSSTSSIAFSWNAGSNTDGSAVSYDLTANGVTVYNATNLTSTSLSVAIVNSAPTSGAYILKSDLINKFASSNYNGTLNFTLTTKNNYGSAKTSSKSIAVDLRVTPTPATPTINKNSNSTAYHTVATTGNSYFVPDGAKKIRVSWSGGSDYLGTTLSYDVQIKIGSGGYETKFSNLTTTYCDIVLAKQSVSQSFSIRVITKTGYNYSSYKDTSAETLHYYNQPTVDLMDMTRTSTAVTAKIKLSANTSIPNVNFTTRSYTGVSSGTLTNTQSTQSISASGLNSNNKYTWTISVIDDVGLYTTAVTKTIEIPAYTPLFSVREKGVGVKAIPDGNDDFIVGGSIRAQELNLVGFQQAGTADTYVNQWIKIATLEISGQYGDSGFTAQLSGNGNGGAISTSGQIVVRLKQQNPMGQAPVGSVYLHNAVGTTADCVKLVITQNTTSKTVGEVWFKNIISYETVYVSPIRRYGTVIFHEKLAYQSALPSGIQIGCTVDRSILNMVYPVGSIYMSVNSTNPSSLFGGTWVAWGTGRVPVGIDTSQTEFNTVEKTGGAKSYSSSHTHTTASVALTVAQLPAHNHSASTSSAGAHTHNIQTQKTKWGYSGSYYVMVDATTGYTALANPATSSAGAHTHSVTVNNTGSGQAHGHGNTGSASVSCTVLQPYITCYMWKRTA